MLNPGFEEGWHYQDNQGELKIGDGWHAWYVDEGSIEPGWKNRRPEYNLVTEAVRVRSGTKAQQYGIVWATHWAGIYQQISGFPVGIRVCFSIWGYVFGLRADQNENHPGNLHLKVGIDPTGGTDPHASTVVWSEEVGDYRSCIAYTEGSDAPWHQFVVETEVLADTITVFTYSNPEWPLRNLAVQWDDAELSLEEKVILSWEPKKPLWKDDVTVEARSLEPLTNVKLVVTTPAGNVLNRSSVEVGRDGNWYTWTWVTFAWDEWGTYTLEVTADGDISVSGMCYIPRGHPRVQYDRTYVLLPPNAGAEWPLALLAGDIWNRHRFTIGGSADDAGIGRLDYRRIVAINPQEWGEGEDGEGLKGFFSTYYPGILYVPIEEVTLENIVSKLEIALNPVEPGFEQYLLWQCDPQWGSLLFGRTGCNTTICVAACYITSLSMAQRIYGIKDDSTPVTVDTALGETGYSASGPCLALWSACPDTLNIRIRSGNTAEAEEHIRSGGVAMVRVLPNDPMHFVLIVGIDDEQGYMMLDPYINVYAPLTEYYTGVHSWRILTKVESEPSPSVPLLIGMHDNADWMLENELEGCCLVHHVVQTTPNILDYRHLQDMGITVLCRLGYGYADGTGTIARPEKLVDHLEALIATIAGSQGVDFWHPWNEPNNVMEMPGFNTPNLFHLTPGYIVASYNYIYEKVGNVAAIGPPPIDPYFGPGSDNWVWQTLMHTGIVGASWIPIHAKTQTNNPNEVLSYEKFSHEPLTWQYLHMRTIETTFDLLPNRFKSLPIFVTECNPQHMYTIGGELGWDVERGPAWISEAVAFLRSLGYVSGVTFYRNDVAGGGQEPFALSNKPPLLDAIKIEMGG